MNNLTFYGGFIMNRVTAFLAAAGCLLICSQLNAAASGSDQPSQLSLDSSTASQLQYLYDQEKLALDLNWVFHWKWDEPTFQSLGALERRHMDALHALMKGYGLKPLLESKAEGGYGEDDHQRAWDQLLSRGSVSRLEAYRSIAYVEEWDITEIRALIGTTNQQSVINASTELLTGAEQHLQRLVSRIKGLGRHYEAQLLSQSDVDEICAGIGPSTGTDFTLNGGLNDAWYYPFTSGQGFFITVYPDSQTVFLSWYTYDTELPGEDVANVVGDAGQRWLTAQGKYVGNRAVLDLFSASGGLLDSVEPAPKLENIGFITLQFDNCSTGSITYTLEPLWGGYIMPIERVAPDNIARCEADGQP
jgi:hypothetical protein